MRDLFNSDFPEIHIDKPIRLIELFGGYGSQSMALERIGADFEPYFLCEFDEPAVRSYNAVHGTNFKPSDIRDIHGADLKICDTDKYFYLLTYSFPCFVGDTLVLTNTGLKEIRDVKKGDSVLTHMNEMKTVLKSQMTGTKEIWSIRGMAVDELKCTASHLFYTREMYRTYPTYENGKRGSERHFKEPEWVECKNLTKSHYLGIAINQNSRLPVWGGIVFDWSDGRKSRVKNEISKLLENHSFWWLVGRYVGDGWVRSQGGIIICCAKWESREITVHLRNCGFNHSLSHERSVNKIHIPLKELEEFLKPFGKGAENKRIPAFMFDMPCNYLESFLEGYLSADGYVTRSEVNKVSSVSRELVYGMAQLVAKAYKTPYRIYKIKRKPTVIIEGRLCNQKDNYELVWKTERKKQDKAFYEDGYIWFPIQEVRSMGEVEQVYDIEVADCHSFTANGVIAHNCTDLSVAGKMAGMARGSGTRSGLLWEVERILRELKESGAELPQCLFMENVPQVISEQNAGDFNSWRAFLQKLGYTSYLEILNAKDYGVAQNRERAFMFSFLGDVYYEFPKPIPLEKRLVDYLEEDVDEKYYLKSEKAKRLIDDLIERGELECKKKTGDDCGGGTRYALTERSTIRAEGRSRTASSRDTTAESATCVRTERSSSKTLIPCKMNGVSGGKFLPVDERTVGKVGCDLGSAILARYYKDATGDGDNMVIEMNEGDEYEKDADTRRGGQV